MNSYRLPTHTVDPTLLASFNNALLQVISWPDREDFLDMEYVRCVVVKEKWTITEHTTQQISPFNPTNPDQITKQPTKHKHQTT